MSLNGVNASICVEYHQLNSLNFDRKPENGENAADSLASLVLAVSPISVNF